MVDSISPFNPNDPTSRGSVDKARQNKSTKDTSSSEASTDAQDQVTLSDVARDIQVVKENMTREPSERIHKLRELVERVQRGEYTVDPDKIARKMFDDIETDPTI